MSAPSAAAVPPVPGAGDQRRLLQLREDPGEGLRLLVLRRCSGTRRRTDLLGKGVLGAADAAWRLAVRPGKSGPHPILPSGSA